MGNKSGLFRRFMGKPPIKPNKNLTELVFFNFFCIFLYFFLAIFEKSFYNEDVEREIPQVII